MHLDPKCVQNKHKCREVCISAECEKPNPFICGQCENQHTKKTCNRISYKKLITNFHKIQGIYTNQMLRFEERVENTFQELIHQLRAHFIKFREEFQYTNIVQRIANIYDKIKANEENQLTAKIVHKAYSMDPIRFPPLKVTDELTMRMLKQKITEDFNKTVKRLPPYYSLKSQVMEEEEEILDENLVGNIQDKYVKKRKQMNGIFNKYYQSFEQLFGKEILNVQMLYRATQNNFSARQFHKKCDGISNTVTCAKTEFGNIVIGFCSFPWASPKMWEYKEDRLNQCFLMSPNPLFTNLKMTAFKTKFAIGMHADYGPSFGDDFVIYDKAQHSKNCWSNFPDVYSCKDKKIPHNEKTIKAFVGVDDHFQKFNLKQWEVYKLSYSKQEEIEGAYMNEYRKIK